MPEIWMDVDTALAEVPVNVMPLIDDTDFKTIEDAVAYNATGMDLRWNFVTTAGAYTSTAVTPTTAGDYDWTHQGDGMYTIEIPASGGASINNDTEGFGWFSGKATGVLPWRGPVIGFRAAGLNNLLIDDAYSATRGLAGTALPSAAADAAGGIPVSDAGGLDLDTQLGKLVGTIATGTHNPQSGDAYARLGAPAGASVSADVAAVKVDTAAILDDTGTSGVVVAAASKTGYSLTATTGLGNQTANITGNLSGSVGSVTGNVGGNVTGSVGSISGVTFPTNFGDLAITVTTGKVTVGTNDDKTGYSLTAVTGLGNQTADITGNLSGSVGSVTGAVGSVTGAVGSVTGNVGGNVTGSVGSVLGGINTAAGTIQTLDALDTAQDSQHATTQGLIGTPTDFGSGTSTLAANLQDIADNGTATYDRATDSLQAIRDRGDAAWITATGFSTLDAAGVRTAVGLAAANLDTQLGDIPTVAEFEARTLAAAAYFDPATDDVTLAGGVTHGDVSANLRINQLQVTRLILSNNVTNPIQIDAPTGAPAVWINATADSYGTIHLVNMGAGPAVSAADGITADVTGNLSGSVGSVTGAVGSVTGNVGGNVTGSVGSVATGGITAASIATDAIDADALAADAVGEIADAVWDEVITGAEHNVNTSAAKFLREASATITGATGTAQAGGTSTITLAAGASATDQLYQWERIAIIDGTGTGQAKLIVDYNGTTKVATVNSAWAVQPDNTSVYAITGADVVVDAIDNQTVSATAAVDFDDLTTLATDWADGGRLDLILDAVLVDTGTTLPAQIAALNNLSAADVNAQVLDVLNVDTLVAGVTIAEAVRRIGAITSGTVSGAGSGTETFVDYAGSAATIVVTVDGSGNRSGVTYN